VLWTYDARGQVHDILEGKGRLLFLVDVSVPIPGTVIRPVLEVALVSLSSGQELVRQPITRDGFLARMLARLNLWIQGDGDAHFGVRSFDGDIIVMEALPPEGHSCQGVLLKTLRLSPPEKGLSNRDTCEHPKGAPALAAALGQDCRGSPSEGYVCDLSQLRRAPSGSNPRPIALKLGSDSLTLTWTGEGVLLEQSSSRGRWSAFDRQQHAAPLKRIWGMEGAVFLERESSDTGILECLAFDSGQPRWSYDFPTSR